MPSQGFKLGGSAQEYSGLGDWSNVSNVLSDTDSGAYSQVTVGGSLIGTTDILFIGDFNFSIPLTATLNNISVQYRVRTQFSAAHIPLAAVLFYTGPLSNDSIYFVDSSTFVTNTISQSLDTWGFMVPPDYLNTNGINGFGVGLYGVGSSTSGAGVIYLDWVKVQIDYTGGFQARGTSLGFPAIY